MDLFPFFEKTTALGKAVGSNLEKINKLENLGSHDAMIDPDKRKKDFGTEEHEKQNDEAGDHFESLKTSADIINKELEKKNSPYRFYIYREYSDIFINLVRLGDNGEILEVKRKNITHQEFADLIKQLEKGEGLFFSSIS